MAIDWLILEKIQQIFGSGFCDKWRELQRKCRDYLDYHRRCNAYIKKIP